MESENDRSLHDLSGKIASLKEVRDLNMRLYRAVSVLLVTYSLLSELTMK